jgi:predicted  nucleic acid-binding Zn-ribbon protein
VNEGTARFVFQILAVAVGGGTVQLTIFLLKRRAELRSLDATTGSTALVSANAYIVTLQKGEEIVRGEVKALKDEMAKIRRECDEERFANTLALETANRKIERFVSELARVKTDLAVATAEISNLRSRLSAQGLDSN